LLEEAEELVQTDKMRIREELNRSKYDEEIFDYIINQPVVSVTGIAESLEINKTVVQNRLEQYRKIDLIQPGRKAQPTTPGKPRKYFEYADFLDLFDHDLPG
jgi:predicted transcriptional regulator